MVSGYNTKCDKYSYSGNLEQSHIDYIITNKGCTTSIKTIIWLLVTKIMLY